MTRYYFDINAIVTQHGYVEADSEESALIAIQNEKWDTIRDSTLQEYDFDSTNIKYIVGDIPEQTRKEKTQQNIDEGISDSVGSYYMCYGDTYYELTPEEQKDVREGIEQEIQPCAGCGRNWYTDSMNYNETAGGEICYNCEDEFSEELCADCGHMFLSSELEEGYCPDCYEKLEENE